MTITDAPTIPVPTGPPASRSGPRGTLRLLRGVALVHLVAVVAQPLLAGAYLGGEFDALAVHGVNAEIVMLLGLVLIGAALLYWLPGRGRGWPVLAAVGFFLAEGMQTGFGYARALAIHIPLGVAIVTGAVLFTIWALGQGARRSRRPLRRPLGPSRAGGTR